MSGVVYSWILLLAIVSCTPVRGQSECPEIQESELGSTTTPGTSGLIAEAITLGDSGSAPDILVLDSQTVCLAAAATRNRYRYASVVVSFNCSGSLPPGSPLGISSCNGNLTAQFDFECVAGPRWGSALTLGGDNVFNPADGMIRTALRTDCSFCADPVQGGPLGLTVDMPTHCADCADGCIGARLCIGILERFCCNFFNFDDECVLECPQGQIANSLHECSVGFGFVSGTHTFSEGDGTVSIALNVSDDVDITDAVRITGGPGIQQGVIVSGADINETLSLSSSSITFTITNDDVAIEAEERYTLLVTSLNSRVLVEAIDVIFGLFGRANVSITDDDVVTVGFVSDVVVFNETDGGSAVVTITRNSQVTQPLFVQVTSQGGADALGSSAPAINVTVEFPALASGAFIDIPLPIQDDDVALEDIEIFTLFIDALDPRVQVGGEFGTPEGPIVFHNSTEVQILDDDDVIVGFQQAQYTFNESDGSVSVRVSRSSVVAQPFTVQVTGGPTPQTSVVISGPQVDETLTFGSGPVSPFIDVILTIQNDDVALEADEIFDLTVSSPSNSLVQIGGSIPQFGFDVFETAGVTILDDDDVIVGFQQAQYTFNESDGSVSVRVSRSSVVAQPFTVQVTGGPTPQTSVVISGPQVDETLTFGSGPVSPFVDVILTIQNDDVALEADEIFDLTLSSPSNSLVQIGGSIPQFGFDVFETAGVTILDDDVVIVGFQQAQYTFNESDGSVSVRVSRSSVVAQSFTVQVTGGPTPQTSVVISGPQVDETLTFGNGPVSPFVDVILTIQDDDVALEADEIFDLTLSSPSNSLVQIGGSIPQFNFDVFETAGVTILDDDVPPSPTPSPSPSPSPSPTPSPVLECIVVGPSDISTFAGGNSYTFNQICEHILVTSCDNLGFNFSVRIDFLNGDIAMGRVGIRYKDISAVIDEVGTITTQGGEENTDFTITMDTGVTGFNLLSLGVNVTRTQADPIELSVRINDVVSDLPNVCGLCGNSIGQTVLRDLSDVDISDGMQAQTFFDEYFVDPGEITLREGERPECGILGTDIVIGDPLFTVPVYGVQERRLCYEIHGAAGQYFNLISDECLSVNAHYVGRDGALNVLDKIGIRAVNRNGRCLNISVNLDGCTATVNGVQRQQYRRGGIQLQVDGNIVTVSVPNCFDTNVEMEVECQNISGLEMLRFEVTRGLNLREDSHGLIGQFWNIPILVEKYNGMTRDNSTNVYIITVTTPSGEQRIFPAWLEAKTWDGTREPCLYAGSYQGGTVYEVVASHDPVIEGTYADYTTAGSFDAMFTYSHFDEDKCVQ